MRALRNYGERDLRIVEVDAPAPPADDEIQLRICAVALNHIDVWGWRGMAFAKRELPITVGAEASGEIIAVGNGRILDNGEVRALDLKAGDKVLFGKYSGTEVKVEGEDHLILREDEILAVVEK